jgi:hypothetical protein
MSLDNLLTAAAREVALGVAPPQVDLEAVRAGARRRHRRTTVLVAAATVATAVLGGIVVTNGRLSDAPDPVTPIPTITPTDPAPTESVWVPDSITPEQIVRADDARPVAAAISAGDPDTRLSIWHSAGYSAIAVTADGYETVTYGAIAGVRPSNLEILSPGEGLFLLTGVNHDEHSLVGADGTVRRLAMVHKQVEPGDDRLWFQCADEGWRYTWCALDPDTATAYVWPKAWDGSAVPPGPGVQPWGANPEPRAVGSTGVLEAWWGAGPDRQTRALGAAEAGDYVLGCAPGLMALWSLDSGTIDIHTSRDGGATWQVASYAAPQSDIWWQVRCLPDGSWLASSGHGGLSLWRASASGHDFEKVFEASGPEGSGFAAVANQRDPYTIASGGIAAYSTDEGRSWTKVESGR